MVDALQVSQGLSFMSGKMLQKDKNMIKIKTSSAQLNISRKFLVYTCIWIYAFCLFFPPLLSKNLVPVSNSATVKSH